MAQTLDLVSVDVKQESSPKREKPLPFHLICDDFYALFLDSSRTYSCAKFYSPSTTLEEAQQAKIDLALAKCELRAGYRLLDIGCGWGATAMRARRHHAVKVTGLTTSKTEYSFARQLADGNPNVEFRLESWDEYGEPADRILCVEALAHFGRKRYGQFFGKCRSLLEKGGILVVQTLTQGQPNFSDDFLKFAGFLAKYVFPTGDIPAPELILRHARLNRFEVVSTESLRMDQVQTLDTWNANLKAKRDEAVKLVGEPTYRVFRNYFALSAAYFRTGNFNLHQFKLRAI